MKRSIICKKKHLLIINILGNLLLIVIGMSTSVCGDISPIKPPTKSMEYKSGKLTTEITSMPLKQVMEEFSRLTGVTVLWQGRETERMVGVRFSDYSLDEAVRRILRSENFVLFYTSTKGEEELKKILVLPREEGRKAPEHTPNTVPDPRLFAMAERAEGEMEEWYEIEPDPFDQYEVIENLADQLLLEGKTEAAEDLIKAFPRILTSRDLSPN